MIAEPTLHTVGRAVPRLDGPDKVAGRARYTADVNLPDTLWGKVLRGPLPHARIVSIDAAAARALPGVHAVVTAADLPKPDARVGRGIRDTPLLARDKVRYIGEPVALVAAESAETADEALALIQVEYEELEAVTDPLRALQHDAPAIHPDLHTYGGKADRGENPPPNLQGLWRDAKGDVEEGFRQSDLVVEGTYATPPQHQGYLEPHSAVAHVQADGSIDIWLTNKTPFPARAMIASVIGLQPEQVRVHPAPIGGDFGGKGNVMVAPLAAVLTLATRRPVRIVLSYVEELMAGNPRHGSLIRIKAGAKRDGTLVAWQAESLMDSGAYGGFKPAADQVPHGASKLAGPYRIPNVDLFVRSVYTNTVQRGNMRAPGEPQTVFARELHLDVLAHKLGIDPLDLRRRNLLNNGEEMPSHGHWDNHLGHEVLEAAAERIGWTSPKTAEDDPGGTLAIGRGLAVAERGTGTGFSTADIRLNQDGTAEIFTAVPDQGAGAHTIMQMIASEVLGLDPTRVHLRVGGTDEAGEDSGAGGSRVTNVAGNAVLQAATDVARQVADLAAETHGWLREDVVLREGKVGPQRTFAEEAIPLATLLARYQDPIQARARYEAARDAHGIELAITVQAAEVAVDRETGQVQVRRYVSAHDVGTLIHPVLARGQIEGGIAQGLGAALMEEVALGADDGRVSTLSLGDYKLPTQRDMPPLEMVFLGGGQGPTPFGGKGIGEASTSPVAPAIANAILDAVGVAVATLPITAEKVLAILEAQESTSD